MLPTLRCLRLRLAVVTALTLVACRDPFTPQGRPTADHTKAPPSPPAWSSVHLLPPLDNDRMPQGESDASHSVAAEIRAADDSSLTSPPLARFSTKPHDPTTLRIIASPGSAGGRTVYTALWHAPRDTKYATHHFALRILIDDTEAARCDIRIHTPTTLPRTTGACNHTLAPGQALPIRFWIEKPRQLLSVHVGPGVVGTPSADTLLPYDHRIRYTFTAAPGYEHVLVRVDGLPAHTTGTIHADTSHTLTASADRHVTLTTSILPLYRAARALLDAPDPVAAFQSYLTLAANYADTHDDSAAIHDLQDAEFLAFDPISDSASLRRLDDALATHEFAITSSPSGTQSDRTRTNRRTLGETFGETIPDSLEPTVFLYVNGIFTPQFGPSGAVVTNTILRRLIASITPFDNRDAFDVRHFYNRTHGQQRPTPEQQRAHCVSLFGARLAFGYMGANSFGPFMADCMADSTYRRLSDQDLLECIRQMLSLIANTDAAEVDALRLATTIQNHRTTGHHLILVPHSQGNLMANQAIHHLESVSHEYDPSRDSTCIGTISLASPTSRRWELPPHYLVPIVVRGDVVPTIDNDWPPIDTDLSHRLLDQPSLETVFAPTGIILHDVIESYLEQPQSRSAIQEGLRSIYGACTLRSITIHPFSASVTTGKSTTLATTLLNAFDDTLAGRSIRWTTNNAGVAIPNPDNSTGSTSVLGVSPGYATISALNHARRAGIPVTVTPPVTVDPFTFAYRANYDAGFFGDDPHLSGTVSHPGAVPLPPGYLRLVFESDLGQRFGYVNGVRYVVDQIADSVILAGNPYSQYRLAWSTDRLTLSGTLSTQNWYFDLGWTPVTLPVTFARETP